MSTTVVQVFLCGPNERQWQKRYVGVACFVKDNAKKSYFIRVVDIMVSVWLYMIDALGLFRTCKNVN